MIRLLILILLTASILAPLQCFSAEGARFVHVLTVNVDDQGAALKFPEGVACRENQIVVADTVNGRLLRYTLADGDMSGGEGIEAPQVSFPIQVQINSRGEILVLDGKTRQLTRIGPEGNVIGTVNPSGLPDGPAPILRSFAIDRDDNIYLLDVFGARLIVLGPDGKFQRQIAFPAGIGFFSGVTVGPTGTVYLLDSVESKVYSIPAGSEEVTPLAVNLKEYLTFATAINSADNGILFIVDRNGSGVVMLGPDGLYRGRQLTMGWKTGLLYYPSQICLTGAGEAVIADRGNSRVQIFKLIK